MELKTKIKNNKAQIGTTLTWFTATFIIIFIIIVYLFVVLLLSGKSIPLGERQNVNIIDSEEYNKVLSSNFISFLNNKVSSEVEYEDVENIKDLLLFSLDPIISDNESMESLNGDINDLYTIYPDSINDEEVEERTSVFIGESRKILDEYCHYYTLQVPQGFIFPEDASLDFDISNVPWAKIIIPYKSHLIEVKYRQLREC